MRFWLGYTVPIFQDVILLTEYKSTFTFTVIFPYKFMAKKLGLDTLPDGKSGLAVQEPVQVRRKPIRLTEDERKEFSRLFGESINRTSGASNQEQERQ